MPNKYFAKKVRTDYGTFDSLGEYRYWIQLNALRKATDPEQRVELIERQVTYPLTVNGILVGKYIADFRVTYADGRVEVLDFKNPYVTGKGKSTPLGQIFNYKRKLMLAIHGIDVKVKQ